MSLCLHAVIYVSMSTLQHNNPVDMSQVSTRLNILNIRYLHLSLSNHKTTMELSTSDIECLFRVPFNSSALYYIEIYGLYLNTMMFKAESLLARVSTKSKTKIT